MEQNNIKLSDRLIQVASFLPKGAKFADIGSDHAYLPIYVCRQDVSATAIAGEVNKGPFNSALKNVRKNGLENRIQVRLGNGLAAIRSNDEVEQVVIAGMGGALITSILESGIDRLKYVKRIIAQPNIDARKVRHWLHDNGFNLSHEKIIDENGHVYEILVADRGAESPYQVEDSNKEFYFGPYLLKKKPSGFYQKWEQEKEKLIQVINQMNKAIEPNTIKMDQFKQELNWIEEELARDKHSD